MAGPLTDPPSLDTPQKDLHRQIVQLYKNMAEAGHWPGDALMTHLTEWERASSLKDLTRSGRTTGSTPSR